MKKTAITLLLIVAGGGVGANAQTMYDALRFSENNYGQHVPLLWEMLSPRSAGIQELSR